MVDRLATMSKGRAAERSRQESRLVPCLIVLLRAQELVQFSFRRKTSPSAEFAAAESRGSGRDPRAFDLVVSRGERPCESSMKSIARTRAIDRFNGEWMLLFFHALLVHPVIAFCAKRHPGVENAGANEMREPLVVAVAVYELTKCRRGKNRVIREADHF